MCFFISIYSCYIPITVSQSLPYPPSLPGPLLPLSLQKRTGHPGIFTKHGISGYNKNRHILSYWGWTWQPSRRKKIPKKAKESETAPYSVVLCKVTLTLVFYYSNKTQVNFLSSPLVLTLHTLPHACDIGWKDKKQRRISSWEHSHNKEFPSHEDKQCQLHKAHIKASNLLTID